ncbi:hypothetical protein ACWEQ1_00280 [Streptomyces nodosus]
MNRVVYLLVHRHRISVEAGDAVHGFMEDGEPLFWDDSEDSFKVLGLYSSKRLAEERVERARALPGFRRSPNGFFVHEYVLDTACWPNGFHVGKSQTGMGD